MVYKKMPFELSNAEATFQREMDMALKGLINNFVLVYLDDIIVFSRNVGQHFDHLRQIFERCREFGVSLNPKKSIFSVHEGHKWILTATYYFTKWIEAITLKEANENSVLNFYQDLVSRFDTPDAIISDNVLAFIGLKESDLCVKNNVFLSASSNYYPQGNGQAKSTNKNLIKIIKKSIQHNHITWHEELKLALWADRMTPKRVTYFSPYVLVYGKEAKLPISVEFPALSYIKEHEMLEEQPMEIEIAQLMELEETRNEAFRKIEIHHSQMKKTFDKKAISRTFNEGDLVFKWDELKLRPDRHTKFDAMWDGPYIITKKKQHNTFQLSKLDGEVLLIPFNEIHLKPCF
ncbi:uncharacterized protein LOC131876595 [Cryptomeria japonica]|uniref:uncharacterized protein LOC131876595 n=1 Tax=Cryptomeria japonica TaxID=3369 RepID=UPI0027D9DAE8|nr:uncharacterized protein LOC131876595 [Cryptomeria japonica]